jgi:ABC-type nitrate/sulfonate/bicarbonate transport system substrate-binding protein
MPFTRLLVSALIILTSFFRFAEAEEYRIKIAAPETPPSFHNLYLQVAYEKGIFKKNGIIVDEFMQMKGGPLATQAVVSGQVDVTATDVEGVLHSVAAGYAVRAVGAPAARLSYVIAVRKDINTISDLKGMPFAVSRPGALSQYITFPFLEAAGVQRNDVQWLSVGSSKDRLLALMADRVKGAVLYIDTIVEAKDNPDITVLAQVADELPDYPHELLLVRKEDIDKQPEKVTRIVQSIIEACRYLATHREESVDVFIKYAGVERAQAEEAYDRLIKLKGWGLNGGMTQKKLEAAMDMSLQNKAIEQSIPFDQWADFRFQDEALQRIGGPIRE